MSIAYRVVRKIAAWLQPEIIIHNDEYFSWLYFANAGMLNKGHLHSFDYVMKNLQSASPIIEIGSFCGLSTNVITYFKKKYNRTNRVITCDKWIFEGAENGKTLGGCTNISHDDYRDFVKSSFIRNVNFFSKGDLPYSVEMFSDEFFSIMERK